MSQIIYFGTVMSVCDEYNGGRIRVKIPIDGQVEPKDGWPYAFPLLPKTFQTMPKVKEMVFVILSNPKNRMSPRFYVGPIISQYQLMYKDEVNMFGDKPLTLIGGTTQNKLETLNHFEESFGTFPRVEDVGLVGRKSEDIILKDDEINIRCGVRNRANGSENRSLVGDVIFNSSSPVYIQLKHLRNREEGNENLINLVGNKINLVSNSDAIRISESMRNFNNVEACKEELLLEGAKKDLMEGNENDENLNEADDKINKAKFAEPDYNKIMQELHQVPYGDKLVQVLEILRKAIMEHSHPLGDNEMPFIEGVDSMMKLQTWGETSDISNATNLSNILLSDTVRIS